MSKYHVKLSSEVLLIAWIVNKPVCAGAAAPVSHIITMWAVGIVCRGVGLRRCELQWWLYVKEAQAAADALHPRESAADRGRVVVTDFSTCTALFRIICDDIRSPIDTHNVKLRQLSDQLRLRIHFYQDLTNLLINLCNERLVSSGYRQQCWFIYLLLSLTICVVMGTPADPRNDRLFRELVITKCHYTRAPRWRFFEVYHLFIAWNLLWKPIYFFQYWCLFSIMI